MAKNQYESMDEIWINLIGVLVVAIVSIVGTIVVKNGWESYILNAWNAMQNLYNTWYSVLLSYDAQLAEEIKVLMNNLEEAFADSELTLKEFNSIRKSGMPLWNRFLEFIDSRT